MKAAFAINTDGWPHYLLYQGWNMLAWRSVNCVNRIKKVQEVLRARGDYILADQLRSIWNDLNDANEYLCIKKRTTEENPSDT